MPDIVTNVLYQEIDRLMARVKELEAELAEAREALNTIAHGNDYESSTRAIDALKNENVKLRDALDTIEGMATDTTYDIQGIAKGALKAGEGS